MSNEEKIECRECGKKFHALAVHIASAHQINKEEYLKRHPGAPMVSEFGSNQISKSQKGKAVQDPGPATGDSSEGSLFFGVACLSVRDGVSEYDAVYVPEHDNAYQLDSDIIEALALAAEKGDNTFMTGPTGCGKSTVVMELAAIINQPLQRINMDADIRVSDFVGEKVISVDRDTGEQVFVWQDGMLPDAMRRGHWLLIDEVTAASPSILFVLQTVLEQGRTLVLKQNHGEIIKAHPNFRVFCTDNTTGHGEGGATFSGTNTMNQAFMNRFSTNIRADYLPYGAEATVLVQKSGVDEATAKLMVKSAREVRGALANEDCFCTISTRDLINWSAKTVSFKGDYLKGAQLAFMNRMLDDDEGFVKDVLQRIMGDPKPAVG